MKDYIIVAPKYDRSNGIRTLYRLADALISKGYNVQMFAEPSEETDYDYVFEVTKDMQENSIVIYPEIIYGNPLGFKNVVRYVLYFPGKIGGQAKYDSNELVVSFDPHYVKNVPILSIPCLDKNIFYENNSINKNIDCYFVHKGGKFREVDKFKNMVEINSAYPATQQELGDLLRRTEILYSFDNYSLVLEEALACGCKVKIVTKDGFTDYAGRYDELFGNYENQLEEFIRITQNLDNKTPVLPRNLKDVPLNYKLKYLKHKFLYFVFKFLICNQEKAVHHWLKAEFKLKLSPKQRGLINVQ